MSRRERVLFKIEQKPNGPLWGLDGTLLNEDKVEISLGTRQAKGFADFLIEAKGLTLLWRIYSTKPRETRQGRARLLSCNKVLKKTRFEFELREEDVGWG